MVQNKPEKSKVENSKAVKSEKSKVENSKVVKPKRGHGNNTMSPKRKRTESTPVNKGKTSSNTKKKKYK